MGFEVPEGYEECNIPCPKCGSHFFDYQLSGIHMKVKCASCRSFVKFVPKKDLNTWKKKVKERDNYTCQKCGAALDPRRADAHHLLPQWFMPERAFDENNGITLCKKCHKQLHGVGGTIKDNDYEEDK